MRTILVLTVLALVTPAHACHRFKVWRYPWAQRCYVRPTVQARAVQEIPLPDVVGVWETPVSQELWDGIRRKAAILKLEERMK